MKCIVSLILLTIVLGSHAVSGQDMVLPLWPEGIPCENELEETITESNIGRIVRAVHTPTLSVYRPAASKANGTSVIVCPGGGYAVLAWDWEGTEVARWLNSLGITAFVLKYRLPARESAECRDKVALMDAQRAIRLVRSKATQWQLDPSRVGIMGFSAGGHLASTAATHFDAGDPQASLAVETFGSRPDFAILMYPVVSMDTRTAHMGSRRNLLGENPEEARWKYFSNERQVTAETPPTILIHADSDAGVVPENSVDFYLALRQHGVPAALHIYEKGGHGFAFAQDRGASRGWPTVCEGWLEDRGLLTPRLKALIIDGAHNHKDWAQATQTYQAYLNQAEIFSVDTWTISSAMGPGDSAPDFDAYDVVLLNYEGPSWPTPVQRAFEAYIAGGGGLVVVHAANIAFPRWGAFNQMIGLGAWNGRDERAGPYVYLNEDGEMVRDDRPGKAGQHGPAHEFVLDVRNAQHPITRGMPAHWLHTKDELYGQLRGPARNLEVLASAYSDPEKGGTGHHEPIMMTIHYGEGRIFHLTLGHSDESRACAGFVASLQRGAEWAATGAVTVDLPESFPTKTNTVKVEEKASSVNR